MIENHISDLKACTRPGQAIHAGCEWTDHVSFLPQGMKKAIQLNPFEWLSVLYSLPIWKVSAWWSHTVLEMPALHSLSEAKEFPWAYCRLLCQIGWLTRVWYWIAHTMKEQLLISFFDLRIAAALMRGTLLVFIKRNVSFMHHVCYVDVLKIKQLAVHQVWGFNVLHGGEDGLVATGVFTFPRG